jgi:hypothetical protein
LYLWGIKPTTTTMKTREELIRELADPEAVAKAQPVREPDLDAILGAFWGVITKGVSAENGGPFGGGPILNAGISGISWEHVKWQISRTMDKAIAAAKAVAYPTAPNEAAA